MTDRPDIVIVMTDEERAIPPYEADDVLAWRRRVLTGRRWFDEHGVNFVRHYITVPVVTVQGDAARFESYYTTTYLHEKFTRVIAGYYDDRLVKRNGAWKFAEKVFGYAWNEFLLPVGDLTQKNPEALKGWGAFGR